MKEKLVFVVMGNSVADDVLTEQAIRKWFDEAHVAKGKSVFLGQMKPMIDWLDTAEEEDDGQLQ